MSAMVKPAENEDSYASMLALLTTQLVEEEADCEDAEQEAKILREKLSAEQEASQGMKVELVRLREQLTASREARDEAVRGRATAEAHLQAALQRPATEYPEPPAYQLVVTGKDGNERIRTLSLTPVKVEP